MLALLLLCTAQLVLAHDNGMDMSMDGSMQLSAGQMLTYLHFTPGDNLWFLGWVPTKSGAMVGACIGLFLLGVLDRWIAACRAVMEMHWAKRCVELQMSHGVRADSVHFRAMILKSNRMNARGLPVSAAEPKSHPPSTSEHVVGALTLRTIPPFIFWHDLTRGVMYLGQSALQFAFMLAVMYVPPSCSRSVRNSSLACCAGRSSLDSSSRSLSDSGSGKLCLDDMRVTRRISYDGRMTAFPYRCMCMIMRL